MKKYFAFLDDLYENCLVDLDEFPRILQDRFNLKRETALKIFFTWREDKNEE